MIDPCKLGHLAANLKKTQCGKGKPLWLAMNALLRASIYAHDVQHSVWDFALELSELKEFGLCHADLRWLICKGYAEQAQEITKGKETSRTFQSNDGLCIGRRSCFVLTESGLQAALDWKCDFISVTKRQTKKMVSLSKKSNPSEVLVEKEIIPKWDSSCRVVTYGGVVVKQFKLPSPNQVAVLAAFEEEGWPSRVDDPLPPRSDVDPKQRLHDTIRSINRNQRHNLLYFRGDGTGRGILWMPRDGTSNYEDDEQNITNE